MVETRDTGSFPLMAPPIMKSRAGIITTTVLWFHNESLCAAFSSSRTPFLSLPIYRQNQISNGFSPETGEMLGDRWLFLMLFKHTMCLQHSLDTAEILVINTFKEKTRSSTYKEEFRSSQLRLTQPLQLIWPRTKFSVVSPL